MVAKIGNKIKTILYDIYYLQNYKVSTFEKVTNLTKHFLIEFL